MIRPLQKYWGLSWKKTQSTGKSLIKQADLFYGTTIPIFKKHYSFADDLLVGGLEHLYIFSLILGMSSSQLLRFVHHFSEGAQPPK